MTDRELLELAAKAAGLVGECHLLLGDCSDPEEPGGFRYKHPDGGHEWWNPLMDDGDALRLAARLNFRLDIQGGTVRIVDTLDNEHYLSGVVTDYAEQMVVVRRAVVRAAAKIGKGL